jgi:hypothetical protein
MYLRDRIMYDGEVVGKYFFFSSELKLAWNYVTNSSEEFII